ncbi:MAG: lytic transglycosylase domain-containing protein, partial [Holosporales bacterium]|nr:lytic transglycosylase domain-containing protein [Holosporales bacterium]
MLSRVRTSILFLAISVGTLLLSGCAHVASQKPLSLPSTEASFGARRSIAEVIADEERKNGIPSGLLKAIIEIESGGNPYFVNTLGRSFRFKS